MKANKTKKVKKNNNLILGVVAVLVIGIAAFTFLNSGKDDDEIAENSKPAAISASDENGDMVIQTSDITEIASFYGYDELDTYIEVLAVKASDGTIRTAFNTCQVCYASGRGYYIQQGDYLICQNCGNRFKMDDVEVTRGGCNPVPILDDMKEVTDTTITIPKDLFAEAEVIFANWR
jgi:uncharacterized membrane protein